MSTVPNELPEIGSTAQRLRQNPRFDPVVAGVGPEEYFVWTRFDGATTLKDLILMTGFDTPKAIDVVRRLRTMGAILLPNERPEQVKITSARPGAAPAPTATPTPVRAPSQPLRPRPDTDNAPTIERPPPQEDPTIDETKPTTRVSVASIMVPPPPKRAAFVAATPAEKAALLEDTDLSPAEKDRILEMHRRLGEGAKILGVDDLSNKKALKRAYFALSKEFHPDRYYRRRTGSFAKRLEEIFEAIARAYEDVAGERAKRDSTFDPPTARTPRGTPESATPPSPVDYAAELFERACQAEVSGDLPGALRLFAAALRTDAPARYLRRAARCASNAGELRVALEYAKKAANLEPNDVSTARVLAHVLKVAGKFVDAEEVLVLAMMIRTENDQLAHELQADLAEVRRLAAR